MIQQGARPAADGVAPVRSGCQRVAAPDAIRDPWTELFAQPMNREKARHSNLESALEAALAARELTLAWQPVVDRTARKTVCAEALLRWTHPELGVVPPARFVPVAEQAGLIERIGDWVIERACAQAAQWRLHMAPYLCVAVNVSPLQLNRRFVRTVSRALEISGLPPSALELEITESQPVLDTRSAVSTIAAIAKFGVRFVIDDFGAGYSSLSYLRRLPLHGLKIDRSFVMGLPHDSRSAVIVEGLAQIAHSISLTVTAEGVETEEQAVFLRECGIDRMQGFLYSRAVEPDDFVEDCRTRSGLRE